MEEEIDFKEKYLRALATIENLRKSKMREVFEAREFGKIAVALEILPFIDDLHRAMDSINKKRVQKKDILEGVNIVFSKFDSTLKRLSIAEIRCDGEKFSYKTMNAIAQIQTNNVLPGTVVNEIEKGYTINGRLLRPAKVAVSTELSENL